MLEAMQLLIFLIPFLGALFVIGLVGEIFLSIKNRGKNDER